MSIVEFRDLAIGLLALSGAFAICWTIWKERDR